MLVLKMAFRNIFRHRRRSILTGMMMGGGCMLFSIFMGVIDGSYYDIISLFTKERTGHVQLHEPGYLERPSLYKTIRDPSLSGQTVKQIPEVKAWSPRIYSPALAFSGTKTTGSRIVGIDPILEPQVTAVRGKVRKGRFISDEPLYEAIITQSMARILKVELGQDVALITQAADGSTANDLFKVVGITGGRGSSYDIPLLYMHIDTAREFLFLENQAHEIAISLGKHTLARKVSAEINKLLDTEKVKADPWQVIESQFYKAMQADYKGNWITIIVFAIIIAIGVLNTVLMVILERSREFGIMKAMGTRPRIVFTLIVLETVILAFLSIIIGLIGGMLANIYLMKHGIAIPTPVEYGGVVFEKITARISTRSLIMPGVVVMVSALLVSIPPALRAARISPVRAMKDI